MVVVNVVASDFINKCIAHPPHQTMVKSRVWEVETPEKEVDDNTGEPDKTRAA